MKTFDEVKWWLITFVVVELCIVLIGTCAFLNRSNQKELCRIEYQLDNKPVQTFDYYGYSEKVRVIEFTDTKKLKVKNLDIVSTSPSVTIKIISNKIIEP